MLQAAALDPLIIDKGAALAADVDEDVIAFLVDDHRVLARYRVGEQLEIVFCFASDGEDGFAERQKPRHAKPIDDLQLRRFLHWNDD